MGETYRIRPLVWVESSAIPGTWNADTLFGWISTNSIIWYVGGLYGRGYSGDCDSIGDGKAKAEAYYRERLMRALERAS